MSKIRKRIILVLLAAALFGAWKGREYYLQKQAAGKDLIIYGNVDIRQVKLGFRVAGRLQELKVEEGDRVKPGQLLGVLDDTPYRDSLRVTEAELLKAQAEQAKLENGYRREETAQAEALVVQREASYEHALSEMKRQEALYEQRVISKRVLDQATTDFEEAKALLASAKEGLQLSSSGYRAEDIAAGRAGVELASASLAQMKTQLDDTRLYAPAAGIVLTRVCEPGAILAAGQTVYTLSLDEPLWIRAYVDEPDLGRVKLGMKALLRTDSFPEKVYTGKVGFISPEAEFTPKEVETPELRTMLVYRLRIIVDKGQEGLLQGMPVTVELVENE